jgi:phosphatidylglycerol---prolipoprotein diacylglyceryl transferase
VHSVAFELGPVTIYWYGVFVAIGFMAAFWTASWLARREGLPPEIISSLAPWLIGGAIVGARLFYVITYWNTEFVGKPIWEIFMLRRAGLVFYGGFIGAAVASIFYARYRGVNVWKLADVAGPSVALGHVFGRFGCLMTGCCFGKPSTLPWAIQFPQDHWTQGIPVHPTQMYEAGLNLLLFFGLLWLYRRKNFDGQIMAVYLAGYAVLRSVVEVFRGDHQVLFFGGALTPAQFVSIGIFSAGALVFWWRLSVQKANRPVK